LLDELYYKPLLEKKVIKEKYINALFGEIRTIINLNDNLLTSLRENKKGDLIGQAMFQFIPFMKMYQNYINNFENSTKILEERKEKQSGFRDFLKEQQEKSNGQGLSSFLILPIQRVPRYELCLREIIKLTDADNPDLPNLKNCFEKVCEVNKSINSNVLDFQDREKVKSVEERFAMGQDVALVAPARKYVREGYLKKVSRKKDIRYLFILFSDMLLYCSGKEAKKLKLHQKLHFDLYFKIKKVDNNRKYGNKCFELNSTEKSFLVICDDHAVREDWYKDITQCLERMRANRKLADSKAADGRVLDVAPVWIPDDFSDRCMVPQCMKKFTFTRRRHHCRYCGRLICSDCSKNRLPHFHKDNKEVVRVGDLCYDKYKTNFPEFDLKFNRKKEAVKDSKTPRGADYTIDWDDDSDDESSGSDSAGDRRSVPHRRFESAPSGNAPSFQAPDPHKSPKLPALSPTSQKRISAYKPNIKPKGPPPLIHKHSSSDSVPTLRQGSTGSFAGSATGGSGGARYQAMIATMQSKLNKERKHNMELQGQIEDLRAENQRLRKSKVDLMTWSNAEIAKYKREISKLQDQLKSAVGKMEEGQ